MTSNLIRPNPYTNDVYAKRIIIIGNGLLKGTDDTNGWRPVINAIQNKSYLDIPLAEQKIYSQLNPEKSLAHAGFFSRLLISEILRNINTKSYKELREHFKNYRDPLKKIYNFKNEICLQFSKSIKESKLKLNNFHPIIENIIYKKNTAVITTNWDTLLWSNTKILNLIQLHGLITYPGTLILPTEYVLDNQPIRQMIFDNPSSEKINYLLGALKNNWRSESDINVLASAHDTALKWLWEAEELYIYGTAGHTYDVELLSLLIQNRKAEWKTVKAFNYIKKDEDPILKKNATEHWRHTLRVPSNVFEEVPIIGD